MATICAVSGIALESGWIEYEQWVLLLLDPVQQLIYQRDNIVLVDNRLESDVQLVASGHLFRWWIELNLNEPSVVEYSPKPASPPSPWPRRLASAVGWYCVSYGGCRSRATPDAGIARANCTERRSLSTTTGRSTWTCTGNVVFPECRSCAG